MALEGREGGRVALALGSVAALAVGVDLGSRFGGRGLLGWGRGWRGFRAQVGGQVVQDAAALLGGDLESPHDHLAQDHVPPFPGEPLPSDKADVVAGLALGQHQLLARALGEGGLAQGQEGAKAQEKGWG